MSWFALVAILRVSYFVVCWHTRNYFGVSKGGCIWMNLMIKTSSRRHRHEIELSMRPIGTTGSEVKSVNRGCYF
jgi:hypothetical protein